VSRTLFRTPGGEAVLGDSMDWLAAQAEESVDLVVTSPPFALLREKSYGNREQSQYVDWLCNFGPLVRRVLKPTGSFVLDLGGAYMRGLPVRSLYNFRVLIRLVDEQSFRLAEDFYWHNPSKLPSPIEWVNKRKLRAKDSVNTVWWLSKTDWPKADVTNVLAPYSKRMLKLLEDPAAFYSPKGRPSGHAISERFGRDNGGAIPSNLLQFASSESNGSYLRLCKEHGVDPHPARFPAELPEFFIRLLTDPGDHVVDVFGGSGTTGEVAERLGRRWTTIDVEAAYVRGSLFRFAAQSSRSAIDRWLATIDSGATAEVAPEQALLL